MTRAEIKPVQNPMEATLAPPQVVTRFLLAALDFYRRWLSAPLHSIKPGGCRYLPTCSEYASIAIANHGPLRGSALAIWRLLRCNPFAHGGLDPVPPAVNSRHLPHEPLP
jgi:putative membrane protein insertion efficiency factor